MALLKVLLSSAPTVTLTPSEMTTQATTWIGWVMNSAISVFNTITQSPIAMAFIYMALIGVVVGFAKKLLHA